MAYKKDKAKLIRTTLLLLYIICIATGIVWLFSLFINESIGSGLWGTPIIALDGPLFYPPGIDFITEYITVTLFYLALFFLTKWLFLNTRKLFFLEVQDTPKAKKKNILSVAFVSTLLCVGALYSVIDLLDPNFFGSLDPEAPSIPPFLFLLIPIGLWISWSIIIFFCSRKSDYNAWSAKALIALAAGSVLELFISIAVYTTSQDDFYCARGSYAGIVFGTTALLWCFGPAIFFLYKKEKQRSEKLKDML